MQKAGFTLILGLLMIAPVVVGREALAFLNRPGMCSHRELQGGHWVNIPSAYNQEQMPIYNRLPICVV